MSIWIDKQYINQISYSLKNFKWKSSTLANCSCDICGDSKSKKTKARGFFFAADDGYRYICHNCNYSAKFSFYLKTHNPLIFKDYVLECYRETNPNTSTKKEVDPLENIRHTDIAAKLLSRKSLLNHLVPIADLAEDSLALQYIKNRKIPLDDIFYCDHFFRWANIIRPEKNYSESTVQERIVFPFRGIDGVFNGYSARALNGEEPKYYTYKADPDAVFGLNRLDFNAPIYIVEGAIDSIFVENCVAASSSALHTVKGIPKENSILIPDRDIRNKEIMKLVDRFISEGFAVCLLPDTFKYKDFNEAIIDGLTRSDIKDIIEKNTFRGMLAKMNFSKWRKDI